MNRKTSLAKIATSIILVGASQGAVIIPGSATAPSSIAGRVATNMINSSEFNDVNLTASQPAAGTWTSGRIPSSANDASTGNVAGSSLFDDPYTVTFDLGGSFNLTEILFWNWNVGANASAGVKTMEIQVAPTVGGTPTSLGVVNPAISLGSPMFAGESFPVSASNVAEVLFVITEGYGFDVAGEDTLVGISEVRFEGTNIPEPSSLGLLSLAGLALLRRQRR